MHRKLRETIEAELIATGRPWAVVPGKAHEKLLVGGRVVGIVSRTGHPERRDLMNTICQIRRAGRGLTTR